MRRLGGMVLLILFLTGSAAYGDSTPPSHNCVAPLKQRAFATQAQLDRYKTAVDLYQSCLDAFIKEQEEAIEVHRQAVQSAIDDWNKFVGPETKEPPKASENKGDDQEFRTKP